METLVERLLIISFNAEADADPGAGKFAFDDNFLNTATKLYIDDVDNGGDNIEAFLRTIDDSTSTIKGHVKNF